MNIATMATKVKTYGRKDLYILAMGTIESIAENDYYTPESKVHLIRETIFALAHVRTDESLPWHEQRKTPLPEGATEELTLSNINTVRWSLEDVMRNEG